MFQMREERPPAISLPTERRRRRFVCIKQIEQGEQVEHGLENEKHRESIQELKKIVRAAEGGERK